MQAYWCLLARGSALVAALRLSVPALGTAALFHFLVYTLAALARDLRAAAPAGAGAYHQPPPGAAASPRCLRNAMHIPGALTMKKTCMSGPANTRPFTQQMRDIKRGVQGIYGTAPRQLQNWNWQDPKPHCLMIRHRGLRGGTQFKSTCLVK